MNTQSDWQKLVNVSLVSFDNHKAISHTFSLSLALIVGTGLHLELGSGEMVGALGMLMVCSEEKVLWITVNLSIFSDVFPQLLSFSTWIRSLKSSHQAPGILVSSSSMFITADRGERWTGTFYCNAATSSNFPHVRTISI